uniref:Putative ubiquitin-protein ligase n=1 Tax=Trypanosoma vivax (strain Y486) TaxID=1055687 RepID=G0U7Q4_TRYVY|nr:putative ubiquitin-protein ligase [Trypanosoma vivax Y486]
MPDERTGADINKQSKTFLSGLKAVVSLYKQCPSQEVCQKIVTRLEAICSSMCFGDELFIRHLNVSSYALCFVYTLQSTAAKEHAVVRALTVQALALLSDLVPRGGLAIALANGVCPLVSLLKETSPVHEAPLIEELLKCLARVSLEAHEQVVSRDAFSRIVQLEEIVQTHHLRMVCLKCMSCLLAVAVVDEWNMYLAKPCAALVSRFHKLVLSLFAGHRPARPLSKENEAHLLGMMECITLMFDRLLKSKKIVENNSSIIKETLISLAIVLESTVSMGTRGVVLRDLACSPLLTFLFTNSSMAVKLFVKCRVLCSVFNIVTALLEKRSSLIALEGHVAMHAIMENDFTSIPCVAEEQQIVPLLEFLLVVIPPAHVCSECDYYLTLPHHVWQWEDDFHNRGDCTDGLSMQLEAEYEQQRLSSDFTSRNICHLSRMLRIDFKKMQYSTREDSCYPHSLGRWASVAGYFYQRPMCCNCRNVSVSSPTVATGATPISPQVWQGDTTVTHSEESLADFGTEYIRNNERLSSINGLVTNRGTSNSSVALSPGILSTTQSVLNTRVVDEKSSSCFYGCVPFACLWRREDVRRDSHKSQKKEMNLFPLKVFLDARAEVLRSSSTRSRFLRQASIEQIIMQYLPVLISTVDRTVNPVVARHCSVLIMRCVDLVWEYLCACGRLYYHGQGDLRRAFTDICPKLAGVLVYLINTTSSLKQVSSLTVTPFKECKYRESLLTMLASIGISPTTRLPAMSLNCETQLVAMSTLLTLIRFLPCVETLLTEEQMASLMQSLEKQLGFTGDPSSFFPSMYSVSGQLCSFHITVGRIEEVRRLFCERLYLALIGENKSLCHSNPLEAKACAMSSDTKLGGGHVHISSQVSTLPANSIPLSSFVSTEKDGRDERHDKYAFVMQRMHYICECMKNNGDELPSSLLARSGVLKELTVALQDPEFHRAMNPEATEAFTLVIKGLLRAICRYTGLAELESRAVERQPTRFSERVHNNKNMLTILDFMWTPLRVNVVDISQQKGNEQGPSLLPKCFYVCNERFTVLDVALESFTLRVLPCTPLSYIAKCALLQMSKRYGTESCNVGDGDEAATLSQRSEHDEDSEFAVPPVSTLDTEDAVEDEDEIAHPLSLTTSVDVEPPDNVDQELISSGASTRSDSHHALQYANEHVLQTTFAQLPFVFEKSQVAPHSSTPVDQSHLASDTADSVTTDNIVFYCNGKVALDTTGSIMDLCFGPVLERTDCSDTVFEEPGSKGVHFAADQGLSSVIHCMKSMWSKTHTIYVAAVKRTTVEQECGAVEVVGTTDFSFSAPKNVFARLSVVPQGMHCLWAAAGLLSGLGGVLRGCGVPISHDDGRVCSALLQEFNSYFSALMLPPFSYRILSACPSGLQNQHLVSYVLWNYPQVFSFEMRHTLFRLALSLRHVPTPALVKLKGTPHDKSGTPHVHGVEWLGLRAAARGASKVTVQRSNILESGEKALRRHAMCFLPLSVKFENEDGVGVGPTIEFYNILSRRLQDKQLNMWRTEEFVDASGAVACRVQLPLYPSAHQTAESLSYFELLGLLVGRVLMEGHVVELPLHPCFTRSILAGSCDTNRLSDVDPQFDAYLDKLLSLSEPELLECEIMFVLPEDRYGQRDKQIELCPGGASVPVTAENVADFVEAVRQYYCKMVPKKPLLHFKRGLEYSIMPYHLQLFNADELQLLISGPEGKIWEKPEDLERDLRFNHGYNRSSPVVMFFVETVSGWNAQLQRAFLRFVTGSSCIPVGGLQPPITIVRRSLENSVEGEKAALSAPTVTSEPAVDAAQCLMDASLPTVNTCVHYLKLPSYSSKVILQVRLQMAVTEGQETFYLT